MPCAKLGREARRSSYMRRRHDGPWCLERSRRCAGGRALQVPLSQKTLIDVDRGRARTTKFLTLPDARRNNSATRCSLGPGRKRCRGGKQLREKRFVNIIRNTVRPVRPPQRGPFTASNKILFSIHLQRSIQWYLRRGLWRWTHYIASFHDGMTRARRTDLVGRHALSRLRVD